MTPDTELTQIYSLAEDGRPLIEDEDRLAALEELEILDTQPEESFDDIVAIAAALCRVPIALVSLVDRNRQWFKAKVGLDLAQTPIEQSVCSCGLGSEDLLVIPDLTADARTASNALVTPAGGIRFYAGAPLTTRDDEVVGMLCVIDNEPRPDGLTPDQQIGLAALARQTMRLMEMRHIAHEREVELRAQYQQGLETRTRAARSERARRRLERYHRRQRAAQAAGQFGTFVLDLTSGEAQVSPELCALYGLPEAETFHVSELERLILAEDLKVRSTAENRADGSAALDVEFRIIRRSDQEVRWIARRAAFERDEAGAVVRMVGTVHDVTDRRIANDRLASLLALGDRLREAESLAEVEELIATSLGDVLDASRVGYAAIDRAEGTVTIGSDWTDGRCASAQGVHDASRLAATLALAAKGRPLVLPDIAGDPRIASDLAFYRQFDVAAQIVMPLFMRGSLVGLLFVHSTSMRIWSAHDTGFLESVADRAHAALAQLNAEAEQEVLNAELSHRLKNTLAMAASIATQTLKGVSDREPVEAFQKRLVALSGAHDVLMQDSWASARIRTVLEGALKVFAFGDRVRLSGTDVTLGPRAALAMALVIHELGTNAFKYGALSNDGGVVTIEWHVADETDAIGEEQQVLKLSWRESGGPPVVEPGHKGFGSRLIATGLIGAGGVVTEYRAEGFRAEFSASLEAAQGG
jgi:two-component sensor histidine kinase/PAS domain-containing protein